MNTDEKNWGKDALVFRPERHLENPEIAKRALVSFSKGVRNCVGHNLAKITMKIELISARKPHPLLIVFPRPSDLYRA